MVVEFRAVHTKYNLTGHGNPAASAIPVASTIIGLRLTIVLMLYSLVKLETVCIIATGPTSRVN